MHVTIVTSSSCFVVGLSIGDISDTDAKDNIDTHVSLLACSHLPMKHQSPSHSPPPLLPPLRVLVP